MPFVPTLERGLASAALPLAVPEAWRAPTWRSSDADGDRDVRARWRLPAARALRDHLAGVRPGSRTWFTVTLNPAPVSASSRGELGLADHVRDVDLLRAGRDVDRDGRARRHLRARRRVGADHVARRRPCCSAAVENFGVRPAWVRMLRRRRPGSCPRRSGTATPGATATWTVTADPLLTTAPAAGLVASTVPGALNGALGVGLGDGEADARDRGGGLVDALVRRRWGRSRSGS